MKQIDALEFLSYFARLQSRNGGVGEAVSVAQIQRDSDLPRSTVYHHLKKLIEREYIVRRKHGQYCIAFNAKTALIGICTVTSWDVIEMHLERDIWLGQFDKEMS
jgi:DNA-binding transcriptional ArsR family regulator